VQVYFSRFILDFLVHGHIVATAIPMCLSGVFFYPAFNEYWKIFGFSFFALVFSHLPGLGAYQSIDTISPHFGSYALSLFQFTGIILFCYSIFRAVRAITLMAFQFLRPV